MTASNPTDPTIRRLEAIFGTISLDFDEAAIDAAIKAAKAKRLYMTCANGDSFVWQYTITVGPLTVEARRTGFAWLKGSWTISASPNTYIRLTSESFHPRDLNARAKVAIAKGEILFPWNDAEFDSAKKALDAARGLAFEILAQYDWPSDAYRDAALQV